jgi:MFS family permease
MKLPLVSIYKQFPALQSKNYRLYFLGQLISFTGSWLHGVAHGWLVYDITQSAFWLGVVSAVSSIPVLLLSLFGGFLVDKLQRKKLLFFTQTASLILAFTLGVLTIFNLINLPILIVLTFLAGIANAIDNPASQAFVVDIVKKKHLASAIGLNSVLFNTGRVLGPAVAGFLIALIGIGNIFFINALSFLAILFSLCLIKATSKIKKVKENPISAIKQGVSYSVFHPKINKLLLTAAMGAIFCFSQSTIMPVLTTKVFNGDSTILGCLLSATGLGALIGSLIVSSKFTKLKAKKFIMIGCILFIFSTFLFSYTSNMHTACCALFVAGLGLTIQFSSIYATIQHLVKDEFRGRVSSIYVLLFIGLSPLGNIFIGSFTSILGPQAAIRLSTFVMFIYVSLLFIHLNKNKIPFFNLINKNNFRFLKPAFLKN